MTFPISVELEIDGTWVDVSQRARMVPPTIHRGRPDETSTVAPTSTSIVFDNTDGFFTPRNPESPWYPHIQRGLPGRIAVDGGNPYLALSGATGSRATTPDTAALDITGDIFVAVEANQPVVDTPGTTYELAGKFVVSGNQRSWVFFLSATNGRLGFRWSTDGAAELTEFSPVALPRKTAGATAFAVWLDVNSAGVDRVVTFYTAPTIAGPWTVLGFPLVDAGTTSIFSSTAPLELGDIAGSGFSPFPGGIRRAQVRSGDSSGTIVANPDFTIQTIGATSFTDSASRAWTVQGEAKITNRQTRFVGNTTNIALEWPKATRRDSNDEGVATATFTLAGALQRMQQGTLKSALYRLVMAPSRSANIVGYWPLEDGRDSKLGHSPIPGAAPLRVSATVQFESDTSLTASGPLPTVSGGDAATWAVRVPRGNPATQWRVDWLINIPTPHTSPSSWSSMIVSTSGRAVSWSFSINDTDVFIAARDAAGTLLVSTSFSADSRMFGTWVLWSLNTEANAGAVDWSLDIVPLDLGITFGTSGSIASASVGVITGLTKGIQSAPPDGVSFGHFIVSTGLDLGWLSGADTAWVAETAAHRFWRLCQEEQIPAVIVGDNTMAIFFRGNLDKSEPMGPQGQRTLLELLQECADADHGILYEQRNAVGLAFRTGLSLVNQTSQVTLDLTQDGLADPFGPVLDDQRYRNDITVTSATGSSGHATTDPPPSSTDLYEESVELSLAGAVEIQDAILTTTAGLNWATHNQANNAASWLLHLGTWPELRLPQLATKLGRAGTAVINQWVDTDIGDRVTVSNLMRQYDRDVHQLLEGYEETLSLFAWDVNFNVSPAAPWGVGVLDATGTPDTGLARLDDGTTTTAAVVDATTTAILTNKTFASSGWTTSASYYPMLLELGGEVVQAGGAVDVFGFLTFSPCVRSVNGVVKAHASGIEIHVAEPIRLTR